jgi:magnesium transporter
MAESLLSQRVDAIRRLARRGATVALGKVVAKTRIEDLAAAMIHLHPVEQRLVFAQIREEPRAAGVLAAVEPGDFEQLSRELTTERLAVLLKEMDPDDRMDALERLDEERRNAVLAKIQGEEREQVEELRHYPPDTAGGIMSPLAFQLNEETTCREAIASVQEASDHEQIHYVYVLNEAEQLTGVVSLRSLLTHTPSTRLIELMSRDVISVSPQTDQEEVARIAGRYGLLAVPVVDEQRRLLGIVTIDDVIDVIREEAAEDMLLMAGVSEEPEVKQSFLQSLQQRMPWLLVTLIGGLGISEIIARFDGVLSSDLVLAGFIPIVMGMEGNVGIQSATLTVRNIATGRLDGRIGSVLLGEAISGLAMGVVFGLLIGGYCVIRYHSFAVAGAVAIAIITGMSTAALVGTAVPLTMRRLGIDPAIATGPFVTTAMDGLGLSIYLGIAAVLLSRFG